MKKILFFVMLFGCTETRVTQVHHNKPDARVSPDDDAGENDAGIIDDAAAQNPDASTQIDASMPDASVITRPDGCPDEAPFYVNRAVVKPALGQNIVGAKLQGSDASQTTNFVDIVVIETNDVSEFTFSNVMFRYLRYYAPPGSQGDVVEVSFFGDGFKVMGTPFGTAGSTPQSAFDSDDSTTTSVVDNGGGYVGIDVSSGWVTSSPRFTPNGGASSADTISVSIASSTANSQITYALDDEPIKSYEGAFVISKKTTVTAVASAPCMFPSHAVQATFLPGETSPPVLVGQKTYHLGNSLTDTINPWLKPIADSTGIVHDFSRWTIPGAPIKWLAEHQGEGFGTPEGDATFFDTYVQTIAPIDHLTLQPYSDPDIISQGGAAIGFINTALQYNPNVQVWMYGTWPGQTEWATDAMAQGYPDWMPPSPAKNWEDGVANFALYYEDFRDYVDARVEGKSILIIPGGMALAELKRKVEAGLVPGYVGADFFVSFFEDEVHLLVPAQYLVSLVFYSCIYRQSPVNRVTHAGTGLTDEQALVFQQIAWDVVSGYSQTGVVQ